MVQGKIKVIIDRNGCISCTTCWNSCPEFFEQKDALSQIVDKYRLENDPGKGEAPDKLEKVRKVWLLDLEKEHYPLRQTSK